MSPVMFICIIFRLAFANILLMHVIVYKFIVYMNKINKMNKMNKITSSNTL
jgi:hypothetical protein